MRSFACLAALVLGCAAPPPPAPTAPVAPPAPTPTVQTEEPAPIGAPVMVSQRLYRAVREVDISPSGKLLALRGVGGLHVVDVDTGQTRGVLAGCHDDFVFTADGKSIVSVCRGTQSARIWDLATDTSSAPLTFPRPPGRLHVPSQGARVHAARVGAVDVIDARKGTVTTLDTGSRREITNIQDTPSGYLAATDNNTVTIFGPAGQIAQRIPKPNNTTAYSFAASGKRFALADWTGITIYDTETGKGSKRITPCGEPSVEDVEWAPDEQHLIVACNAVPTKNVNGRVIVVPPDGDGEVELLQAETGTFVIKPRGERVALLHNHIGVAVFEIASGAELFRLAPPAGGQQRPRLSRDLERALFHNGVHITGVTVVDRARGAIGPRLTAPAAPMALGGAGDLLFFEDGGRPIYVDPIKNEVRRDAPGRLSPDGATWLAPSGSGFEVIDRRTGARQRLPISAANAHAPPHFSDHGAFVAVEEAITKGGAVTGYQLRVIDARTGKEGKPIPRGLQHGYVWWSRDDAQLATIAALPRTRAGKACATLSDGGCAELRVFDARTGRQLAAIQPKDSSPDRVAFLGDSKQLMLDVGVHDARSGRLLWSIPNDADARSLGKLGLLLATSDRVTLVDPANGKVLRDLGPAGKITAVSHDGAWLLTQSGRATTLWSTATWTRQPTKLELSDDEIVWLSPDGKLAFRVDDADVVVHRFADGRSMRRALPGLDFDVTDQGVFDPAQAASGAALVRRGPDVARSPMGPLSLIEDTLGYRGLYGDFIAGKPVAPLAPAPARP